jgi:DNA-binding winged helix-turn-helix (wHTH) protein
MSISIPAKQAYEFGPFRFDSTARLLFREEEISPLPPKALDILAVLLENEGKLVSKQSLIRAVWPDSFVEEGNVAHHISVIRRMLRNGSGGQVSIETIAKRGYRLTVMSADRSLVSNETQGESASRKLSLVGGICG